MAHKQIVYWRDIPAQVIVKEGRRNQVKKELEKRFIEAIDRVAMAQGLSQTDDYLNEWRKSEPVEINGELEHEAQKLMEEIQQKYNKEKLKELVENQGYENEK